MLREGGSKGSGEQGSDPGDSLQCERKEMSRGLLHYESEQEGEFRQYVLI